MEKKYYLGGYYLVRLKPYPHTKWKKNAIIFTGSTCINDSLLDGWGYAWATNGQKTHEELAKEFSIGDDDIKQIQEWVDVHEDKKDIGWVNLFYDLALAKEYKAKFFPELSDVKILSIYFDEEEASDLTHAFTPKVGYGDIGLYTNLSKKILEVESREEKFIGYDLVGVELGGDFHTFYCNDFSQELTERFGLKINEYGLIDEIAEKKPVTDNMNDEKNGLESVPWFVAKIKEVEQA